MGGRGSKRLVMGLSGKGWSGILIGKSFNVAWAGRFLGFEFGEERALRVMGVPTAAGKLNAEFGVEGVLRPQGRNRYCT